MAMDVEGRSHRRVRAGANTNHGGQTRGDGPSTICRLLDYNSADLLSELDSWTSTPILKTPSSWWVGRGPGRRLSQRHLDVRLEQVSHSDTQDRDLVVGPVMSRVQMAPSWPSTPLRRRSQRYRAAS